MNQYGLMLLERKHIGRALSSNENQIIELYLQETIKTF